MYNGEGINALVCALEDLQDSQLIFMDKNLSRVLRCLAYYSEFRSVLAECSKDFDYQVEKSIALGQIGSSSVLRLPKEQKKLVAFVLNLLVEFDAGSEDMVSFANKYYPSQSKQGSLDGLFRGVIDPFKEALVDFVWNGIETQPKQVERQVEFVSSGVIQETEYLLVKISDTVRESITDTNEREQFVTMVEGLAAALDLRDSMLIKAIWTGLKRSLAQYNLCVDEAIKLDDVLKLYMVMN